MCAWHAKPLDGYDRTSQEAIDNVMMLARAIMPLGWSIKSLAALLGNGAGESGLNPWRWENNYIPTYNEFLGWHGTVAQQHGYGLFGFTPASSYINSTNEQTYARYGYAPNFRDITGRATDGEAQTRYFISTVEPNWSHGNHGYYWDNFNAIGVDIDTFYYMTYQEFMAGIDSQGNDIPLDYMTGAFELCYEKPADWAAADSYDYRCSSAQYWYDVLKDMPIPGTGGDSFNIMFYLKPKYKRM